MDKKTVKKIIIDVTDDLHSKIKINCAINGISIKEWVSQGILKQMREDDQRRFDEEKKRFLANERKS